MRRLEIIAYGRAAPQGSKKGGSAGNMIEASRFLPAWRTRVYAAALGARRAYPDGIWAPVTGPCYVDIVVFIDRPAQTQFPDYPAGEPDVDKLARAILDSLTRAQVYVDDSRVVDLRIRKRWTDNSSGLVERGAKITVIDLTPTLSEPPSPGEARAGSMCTGEPHVPGCIHAEGWEPAARCNCNGTVHELASPGCILADWED